MVQVEISEEIIELLEKRGYAPRRDKIAIGQAVTALLSDLVLEAIDNPSAPALEGRAAMALWQRSAALAGMKE